MVNVSGPFFLRLSRPDKEINGYQGKASLTINKCPLNDLFHDVVTIILTSQTAVSELDNEDDDDDWPLVVD